MIGLLLTIFIGIGIAIISRYSPVRITINPGDNQIYEVPLYYVTVGTYLIGILIASIIEIPQTIVSSLRILGLGRSVESSKNTITKLQNKIEKLETDKSNLNIKNQVIRDNNSNVASTSNRFQNFLHRIHLK